MSYDYAKDKNKKKPVKKNQKSSGRQPIPGWIMFFSGVAFTVFAQFLFHLTQVDTPAQTTNPENSVAGMEEPAHKKPTINFYNQLKTMEVKVPGDESETPETSVQPAAESVTQAATDATAKTDAVNTEKTEATVKQFLQAGSYKSAADADTQRAALSLLGVKSGTETKTNADGITYYRVMVGPFTSATELEKARSTLNSNNVPTMTVKR
jgi:cell division protein FtsN